MEEPRILRAARALVNNAHDSTGQRYCGQGYSLHLDAVDDLLVDWLDLGGLAIDSDLAIDVRVGGRFHDWFEDIVCDPAKFGANCDSLHRDHGFPLAGLEMALRCTDEPGATRKERKKLTYLKIRDCHGARLIKLADRVGHLVYSRDVSQAPDYKFLRLYVSEDEEFQAGVIGGFAGSSNRQLDRAVQVGEVRYWEAMREAKRFLEEHGQ